MAVSRSLTAEQLVAAEARAWESKIRASSVHPWNEPVANLLAALLARTEELERDYATLLREADRRVAEGLARTEAAEKALARLLKAVESENFSRPARAPNMSQQLRVAIEGARAALAGSSPAAEAETPLTFRRLQADQVAWVQHNFGGRPSHVPLLGALEELGELAHAHIKGEQGIRHTSEEVAAMKLDAVGDVVIYLSDYCTAEGIDFQQAVEKTWASVSKRDWKADPRAGGVSDSSEAEKPEAGATADAVAVVTPSCSKPGCDATPSNQYDLRPSQGSWVEKDQRKRTYLVCDDHDAEYFPRGGGWIPKEQAERIAAELVTTEGDSQDVRPGSSVTGDDAKGKEGDDREH